MWELINCVMNSLGTRMEQGEPRFEIWKLSNVMVFSASLRIFVTIACPVEKCMGATRSYLPVPTDWMSATMYWSMSCIFVSRSSCQPAWKCYKILNIFHTVKATHWRESAWWRDLKGSHSRFAPTMAVPGQVSDAEEISAWMRIPPLLQLVHLAGCYETLPVQHTGNSIHMKTAWFLSSVSCRSFGQVAVPKSELPYLLEISRATRQCRYSPWYKRQ
jgi:hypothetical protein